MKKAVVFDMDGVIFDSEKLYRKHWMLTAKEYNIPEDEMRKLCDLIAGATRDRNEKLMKSRYGEDFDYDAFRMATMNRMDEEVKKNGLELKPGVKELFEFLKENGYKIGLATSTQKERAEGNLRNAGLLDYFDYIMYGGIVKNGKPAPDIYLYACEQLHLAPAECMAVEDSPNGVSSAYDAGCKVVMVPDQAPPDEETKKKIAACPDSLDEIIKLFDALA